MGKKPISLFICGCCGKDTRKTDRDVKKMVIAGYANILCHVCRMSLESEVENIARKYLAKPLSGKGDSQ
jgi:hypothetical protein